MLSVVTPVALPPIARLSDPPAAKFASSTTVPPPPKFPLSDRVSAASALPPMLSVPATLSILVAKACCPAPKRISDPAPTETVSQFFSPDPASVPATPLKASVLLLPAPPSSAVSAPMALPLSNVRLTESAASVTDPLIDAPLSTMTLSHPSRPCAWVEACRLPEPPLNVSVSPAPAPPSICVTEANVPPANVSMSDPAPRVTLPVIVAPEFTVSVSAPPPRLTLPAIAAPVFTVTEVSPPDPTIALLASAPTNAPLLSRMVTELPRCASVLIAATPFPVPPVTAAVTVMVVSPLPS